MLLVLEMLPGFRFGAHRELAAWLLTWPVIGLAVLAVRTPVRASLLAAGWLLVASTADRWLNAVLPAVVSPLTPAETAACAVLVTLAVRQAPARQAALSVTALCVAAAVGAVVRDPVLVRVIGDSSDALATVLLFALTVVVGLYLRGRDAERNRALIGAESRVRREERISLARELHDVVAHHVSGMVVQAQAALEVAGNDPTAAHRLLPGIVSTGTDALSAMRRLVGTLRQGDDATAEATVDLRADVLAAAKRAGQDGLPVRTCVELEQDVPPEVGRSVLRLVQESLANARRHADSPTEVEVRLSAFAGVLRLVVADDGRGAPATGDAGYGLLGMRERVELLGGRFAAGPDDRGWRVFAELPLEGSGR
ncbi:sensor histidine kinase [Saccharothrix coeruleofusca]|uniref:sensor histidine kinase n=1 Tax=Saccharothrix coeruleofusca TaxID=33919 RepID=UPI00166FEB95|nr:histidine kinase [Saccharothrix coeruleofusca]